MGGLVDEEAADGGEQVAGPRLDARRSQALVGAVRLLRAHGGAAAAQLVSDRLRGTGRRRPAIVVVGEVKRGKSSLVNALLGVPDLAPVGVDVTTGAFLRFVPATARRPAGSARVFAADGSRFPVPAAEVADWVTVGGARRIDPDAPVVVGAEVAVAGMLVPGVTLVDTPGVGGLDGGHARLAASVAAQAGVLLFVSDAGQPLTAPELRFLAKAAAGVESVVFALTKIDKFPAGHREILAENRALLRRHAPRFADAPVVPVDSLLAAEAARLPDGDIRRAMADLAGVDQLAAVLAGLAEDGDRLIVANAARIAQAGLDQVAAQLTAARAAAAGDDSTRAVLTAERARLAELRDRQQRWTLDLERDLGHLRRGVVDDITTRLTELRREWDDRIEKERRGLVPAVAREYQAQVCSDLAAVAAAAAAGFEQRLRDLVTGTYGLTAEQLPTDPAHDLAGTRPRARDVGGKATGLLDPGLAATAFLGANVASQLPIAAFAGMAINPLALVVGGAWLAVNVAFRAIRAGRTQLRQWLGETVQGVQADLVAAADTALRETKPDLVIGIRQFLADAIAGLDATIREGDRAAASSAGDRERRAASFDRHLAAVAAQQALLDEIRRDPPGTSGPAGDSKP